MASRVGNILYDILNGCLTGKRHVQPGRSTAEDTVYAVSTEDVLNVLEDAEEEVERLGDKVVVGSADVKALYPSLDAVTTAKICGDLVARSGVKVKGFKPEDAALYIAATHTQEEIDEAGLTNLIPKRRHHKGARPGVTSSDL